MTAGGRPDFDVDIQAVRGATVVAVRGEVDLVVRDQLQAALVGAVDRSSAVVVDLIHCSFMDSSGLHALEVLRSIADARDVAIAVACTPDEAPARLLAMLGRPGTEVHPDREAALVTVGVLKR